MNLRDRILGQLLDYLESEDSNELRPKPEVEAVSIDMKPKGPLGMPEESPEDGEDKGPMDKMVADKAAGAAPEGDEDEEISDDDLEELMKQHLG